MRHAVINIRHVWMLDENWMKHSLGCPPSQDSSHHQDYYIFSRESQPKPSFATGILGGGTPQNIAYDRVRELKEGMEENLNVPLRFYHGNPSYPPQSYPPPRNKALLRDY